MELQKTTSRSEGGERRRYEDACAAAHAMDLFGERWAMPVMRELMLGPRRFTDLRMSLNGISAKTLTERLEGLEAAGILFRRKLPPPASVQVYELTPWGYEAAPVFQAMGRWAVRSPRHDKAKPFSPVSLMLSLRTMLSPTAAGDARGRLQLRIGDDRLFWILEDGEAKIGRGEIPDPDAVITASTITIASIVYGGRPIEDAIANGDAQIEGNLDLVRSLPGFFPLPEPAPERIS